MEVIGKAKILRNGDVELSSAAKEKLKGLDLVGKIVKIVIEEEIEKEKDVANPLLKLCGQANIEIKDGSLNHDQYIYGKK